MAYSGDYTQMEDIPYRIVPGDSPLHQESVFLERAIAGERVRLAMGLSLRPVQTRTLLTEGMDHAAIAEQYYEPPLVSIIPYACHACPTKRYQVTDLCQGCLAASCQRVCPKGAVRFVNGKSVIDEAACIKCGKCAASCPYHAITFIERPCQAACGMDAIGVDENRKACIDYERCVSCGQCLVSCPFGAIVDKSQIFQVIRSIAEEFRRGHRRTVVCGTVWEKRDRAEICCGDASARLCRCRGSRGRSGRLRNRRGAGLCEKGTRAAKIPCHLLLPIVADDGPSSLSKESGNISMTYTPMTYTARLVKHSHRTARSSSSARAQPKSWRLCRRNCAAMSISC